MRYLIFLFMLFIVSCSFQTGIYKDFQAKRDMDSIFRIGEGRVWVRSFDHKVIGSVSTAYATGNYGSASGISVSREQTSNVPNYLVTIIEDSKIFKSVTPINTGTAPDFILEGSINASWATPWWTYVQFIDLAFHAWFFPTLGRDLEADAEIRLYNQDHDFINSWIVHYTESYIGNIWWGMTHGGAYDVGSDVEIQATVIKYAMENIKIDLAKNVHAYLKGLPCQKKDL